MSAWPIGVFTSIDAGLGVKLEVARELGIPTIQLHAPHRSTRTAENAEQFIAKLEQLDIQLTAVFGGFEGESYADIPTVSETVGLVPPATRSARLQEMKEISDFSRLLGCEVVALHLGFVPHSPSAPLYQEIVDVTRQLCDHAARNDQNVHLETGQETADGLLQFIGNVNWASCDDTFAFSATFLTGNEDGINGTLFGNREPRLVEIIGIKVEADMDGPMLFIVNEDKPGFIGRLGTTLGEAGVNIGTFHLGRRAAGSEAVLLLSVDEKIPEALLFCSCASPLVLLVTRTAALGTMAPVLSVIVP